jgi:hypothetical protein
MSRESTSYDSVAWGRQLGDDHPPNWLGDLDSHTRAYPERLAQARRYFAEIPFDSLSIVKTGPDRFSFFDAEGTELRSVGFDPLQAANPASSRIVGFTVDDGDRLHYLQRRGDSAVPAEEVVLVWSVREQTVTA